MVSSILPKYKQKTLTSGIVALLERNIFLQSFFGRIEDTINCFQDLLTFSKVVTVILKALNQQDFFSENKINVGSFEKLTFLKKNPSKNKICPHFKLIHLFNV